MRLMIPTQARLGLEVSSFRVRRLQFGVPSNSGVELMGWDPASYEQMSDGALLRIAMDRADLTPEAGAAFDAELAKRGLGEEQVRSFASRYRTEAAAEQRHSARAS